MITETALTPDEKRCLRLWFRQALAKVEREEAKANLLKRHEPEMNPLHKAFPSRKHSTHKQLVKELAY